VIFGLHLVDQRLDARQVGANNLCRGVAIALPNRLK
jgi:hypothetical protein